MAKTKKKNQKVKPRAQYAALPVATRDGNTEVMLITSRDTGRWIIPKGWPEKNLTPAELAAREAYEEAGLIGSAGERPCGRYSYEKRLNSGKSTLCKVDVYLFRVEDELDDWPEKGQRDRRWMSPAEAALLISESGLVSLLLDLAAPTH